MLQSDGEVHRRMRNTAMRPLTPGALRESRPALKARVVERVAALADGAIFDAMPALAALLPVEAISHLVGLPEAGRERMLEWAAAFNVVGPDQAPIDLAALRDAVVFIGGLDPSAVRAGS